MIIVRVTHSHPHDNCESAWVHKRAIVGYNVNKGKEKGRHCEVKEIQERGDEW